MPFARRFPKARCFLGSLLLLLGVAWPAWAAGSAASFPTMPGQPTELSYFGVNGYLTGYERQHDNIEALLSLGTAAGLRWTREEFVWANIEPSKGAFNFDWPDDRLWHIGKAGYGIVGMLLTTPQWARKASCAGSYWCPPQNPNDYYDFVRAVVERYDGDGNGDSADSPRVAYWEIWNEPNHAATWPGSPADYAALLRAGYDGVKAADPTAKVLVGGVYVFDGSQGLAFLDQVLQADPGAWDKFDILSIHPFMPDAAPDQPGLDERVTMLARLQRSVDWVNGRGGGKPVWVTEVGWSTCTAGQGDCTAPLSKTQAQQADYLVRTHAMALAKGIEHLSLFQLEDKFDGSASRVWGECAIVGTAAQNYAPKTAYHAVAVMIEQLEGTAYVGPGPLYGLHWTHEGGRDRLSAQTRFDYRFSRPGGGTVDVLWRPDEQNEAVSFPVQSGQLVTWVTRDGVQTPLTPMNGRVSFTISGHPGYLRQDPIPLPPELAVSTLEIGFLTEPGIDPTVRRLFVYNAGDGTLDWSLTVTSGGQWFAASPTSGTTPGTVTVSATAPGNTGFFAGSLHVDAGAAGQAEVALWMRVSAALHEAYLPLMGR